MNNNWIHHEGGNFHKKNGDKALKKVKDQRVNKKFKMIKVSDHPVTYKEVEIK